MVKKTWERGDPEHNIEHSAIVFKVNFFLLRADHELLGLMRMRARRCIAYFTRTCKPAPMERVNCRHGTSYVRALHVHVSLNKIKITVRLQCQFFKFYRYGYGTYSCFRTGSAFDLRPGSGSSVGVRIPDTDTLQLSLL
jgi:hypothetical protein